MYIMRWYNCVQTDYHLGKRDEIMKRVLFCLLAAAMLFGCGGKPEAAPAEKRRSQASPRIDCVETDYGVCFLGKNAGIGRIIYLCPNDGSEPYVLCNKPNCRHTDENCNAYGGGALGFYDGYLYTVQDGRQLIRMAQDGTGHETVMILPNSVGGGMYYDAGDRMLYVEAANLTLPYEQQRFRFFSIDYRTGAFSELFSAFTEENHIDNTGIFQVVGSRFYGLVLIRTDAAEIERWIMEFDMETGECRKLFQTTVDSIGAVYGSTLFYFIPGEGFMEYDLNSGETEKKSLPVPDAVYAFYGEDLIYVLGSENEGDRTLYFLDRSYALVDSVTYPDRESFSFVTGDRLYFSFYIGTMSLFDAYIEKSEIGGGQITLKKLGA